MRSSSRNRIRVVWIVWSCLCWIAVLLGLTGLMLPYWIRGKISSENSLHMNSDYFGSAQKFQLSESGQSSGFGISNSGLVSESVESELGLFRRCTYPVYTHEGTVLILPQCGHYGLQDIPSKFWQAAIILLGFALSLGFLLTCLVFFLGFCIEILCVPCVSRSIQFLQIVTGIAILSACLLYPLGWKDNPEVSQICGPKASYYSLGHCELGWAMTLVFSSGAISLVGSIILPTLMRQELNGPKSSLNKNSINDTNAMKMCSQSQSESSYPSGSSSNFNSDYQVCWCCIKSSKSSNELIHNSTTVPNTINTTTNSSVNMDRCDLDSMHKRLSISTTKSLSGEVIKSKESTLPVEYLLPTSVKYDGLNPLATPLSTHLLRPNQHPHPVLMNRPFSMLITADQQLQQPNYQIVGAPLNYYLLYPNSSMALGSQSNLKPNNFSKIANNPNSNYVILKPSTSYTSLPTVVENPTSSNSNHQPTQLAENGYFRPITVVANPQPMLIGGGGVNNANCLMELDAQQQNLCRMYPPINKRYSLQISSPNPQFCRPSNAPPLFVPVMNPHATPFFSPYNCAVDHSFAAAYPVVCSSGMKSPTITNPTTIDAFNQNTISSTNSPKAQLNSDSSSDPKSNGICSGDNLKSNCGFLQQEQQSAQEMIF